MKQNTTTSWSPPYETIADIAKTLGHAHRLALLEHVAQGERPVETLAKLCGLSLANASQHLLHLRRHGFVESRRDGKNVLYRLGDGPIINLLLVLKSFADYQKMLMKEAVADSINRPGMMDAVSIDDLITQMRTNSVILLDARSPEEFALGHLPGAINIPPDELDTRMNELPTDKPVVAYCRGPFCVLSTQAVSLLNRHGRKAHRLNAGFPEWKAAGLAIGLPA